MRYSPRRLSPGPKHLKKPPRPRWRRYLGEALYYLALALFILAVFLLRGSGDGPPARIFGFSAMRVLTSSMGEDIPQGSLVITREVDPSSLQIGDDVTYLAGQNVTVTHRVVDILEDYAGTGHRAFVTQGTANSSPDSLVVPDQNLVGKVIFHNLLLGQILAFLRTYWLWLAASLALMCGLVKCLQVILQESRPRQLPKKREREEDGHEV